MSNVVPLHNSPSNDRKPSQKDEVVRATNTARAKQIQRALGDTNQAGPRLRSADQEIVAHALYGLLEQIEKDHRISKAEVMREAHLGGDGDSTKHLSQYAIPKGGSPKRLRKKAGSYAKLARAAAKLSSLDEDEALMEVFGQASFWSSMGAREPAEEYEELATRLRYIMNAVAQKHKLGVFFRNVRKCGGVLTPSANSWVREQEMGDLLAPHEIEVELHFDEDVLQRWPIEFSQPTYEATDGNGDHVPFYPSLQLGAWRFPFPVSIKAQMTDAIGSPHPMSGTVEGHSSIELRLCIVPIGKNLEATPALRVQWTVALSPLSAASVAAPDQVEVGGGDTPLSDEASLIRFQSLDFPLLKRGRSKIVGHSIAGDREVDCEAFVENDTLPKPFKDYFGDTESATSKTPDSDVAVGVRFLPLDGMVCEDWFSLKISERRLFFDVSEQREQRLADRIQRNTLVPLGLGGTPSTDFRLGTLADVIDRCLCDASNGLDLQFDNQAERLVRAYDESRSLARRERTEGWDRVKKRWETFSSLDPPDGPTD